MPVKINGSTSGSVTLAAPATGSDVTLTLPAAAGTVALTASQTLTDPTFTGNVVWSAAALRANTASVATEQTTTSTSYTDLATAGPAVTVTTGTKALVIVSANLWNSGATQNTFMGFAVSGATTVAANDNFALQVYSGSGITTVTASFAYIITGLTAGSNTFTAKYRVITGTGNYRWRTITVVDMGS